MAQGGGESDFLCSDRTREVRWVRDLILSVAVRSCDLIILREENSIRICSTEKCQHSRTNRSSARSRSGMCQGNSPE
jgi:hypothetical protein